MGSESVSGIKSSSKVFCVAVRRLSFSPSKRPIRYVFKKNTILKLWQPFLITGLTLCWLHHLCFWPFTLSSALPVRLIQITVGHLCNLLFTLSPDILVWPSITTCNSLISLEMWYYQQRIIENLLGRIRCFRSILSQVLPMVCRYTVYCCFWGWGCFWEMFITLPAGQGATTLAWLDQTALERQILVKLLLREHDDVNRRSHLLWMGMTSKNSAHLSDLRNPVVTFLKTSSLCRFRL